jgi:hypothetical protein
MRTGRLFREIKQLKREADHSPPLYCRGYEYVELYLHLYKYLHGVHVVNLNVIRLTDYSNL